MSAAQKSAAAAAAPHAAAPSAAAAASSSSASSKQDDIRARMAQLSSDIEQARAQFDDDVVSLKAGLALVYGKQAAPQKLADILRDELWKTPLIPEFAAKYGAHEIAGARDLAALHTRIASLQQELAELSEHSRQLEAEDKVGDLDDAQLVLYRKMEALGARLVDGHVRVDAKVCCDERVEDAFLHFLFLSLSSS